MSGAVVDSLDNGLDLVVVRERNALLRRYRISSTCCASKIISSRVNVRAAFMRANISGRILQYRCLIKLGSFTSGLRSSHRERKRTTNSLIVSFSCCLHSFHSDSCCATRTGE